MSKQAVEHAFNLFADSGSASERQVALTNLIALKALPKYASDPRFERGVSRWREVLDRSIENSDFVPLAVAEIVRSAQVVKYLQPKLREIFRVLSDHSLPSASLLKDASDRLNLARALRYVSGEWVACYVARSIAEEDAGEKARAEFMGVLFSQVDSISSALALLIDAFSSFEQRTESPGDAGGRRLLRTLTVLRNALVASRVPAGDGVGVGLDALVRTVFRISGMPDDQRVQLDLTHEVALTLHDLMRTRFSVSTESQTFNVLKTCRKLFPGTSWPDALSPSLDFLLQDVMEALVVLGRQNIPDQALLEQLFVISGFRDRAQALAADLANRHPEFPERIRGWLRRGRLVAQHDSSEVLEETILRASDAAVGFALLEASALNQNAEIGEFVIESMQVYEPAIVDGLRSYVGAADRLARATGEIAKRRRLMLLGRIGHEIEYTPKYFESSGVIRKKMMVRRPAVVRTDANGNSSEVVVIGLVD